MVFAGPSRNKCLQSVIKTKANGCKHEVINTCYARNSELLFTNTAKENIVGDKV